MVSPSCYCKSFATPRARQCLGFVASSTQKKLVVTAFKATGRRLSSQPSPHGVGPGRQAGHGSCDQKPQHELRHGRRHMGSDLDKSMVIVQATTKRNMHSATNVSEHSPVVSSTGSRPSRTYQWAQSWRARLAQGSGVANAAEAAMAQLCDNNCGHVHVSWFESQDVL